MCFCPEGHLLSFRYLQEGEGKRGYYGGSTFCRNCRHYGVCTRNATTGRQIIRYENDAVRERLVTHDQEPGAQVIYARCNEKMELPLGHLKRNLGGRQFCAAWCGGCPHRSVAVEQLLQPGPPDWAAGGLWAHHETVESEERCSGTC